MPYRLTELSSRGEVLKIPLTPTKIVCLGQNYRSHAAEMGFQPPKEPVIFLKPPSALIGDGGTIELPAMSRKVHHEVELALVVGERAKNVDASSAYRHIYGYTIMLDITARDLQDEARKKGLPYTLSKGFDTFAPIYHVVPTGRIPDPHRLQIWLKLNGELRQNSNTSEMIFKVDDILSYVSKVMTLEPGDVISTGTPSGVGPIHPGDNIEAYIEGIGTLRVNVK